MATVVLNPQPAPSMPASVHHRSSMRPTAIEIEPQGLQTRATLPVERDGAFHLDRMIKNGWLLKRNRKTKGWRKRWVVLRGDRLSVYKDETEYKIQKQILLADLTAVALLKDAKKPNVFGCFSPSRNYHFQGESATDAQEWVDLIKETAVLKDNSELRLADMINKDIVDNNMQKEFVDQRLWTSSPEPGMNPGALGIRAMNGGTMSSHTLEYSGAELASCSSVSDIARISQLSLAQPEHHVHPPQPISEEPAAPEPGVARNLSGFSADDDSKTIWHGYLYVLKSKGGMKQWKKTWVVLRSKNLAFYKDDEEYRAIRLIPLDDIIDAVEIDPLSKSKKHCMEVITGGKSLRFCAPDEEALARWLGTFKSTLTKRRLAEKAEETAT